MCWFALLRKIWVFLAIYHAQITANDNFANKPYFCLILLANLADLLRLVDARSIISGSLSFSPLAKWPPTGCLG